MEIAEAKSASKALLLTAASLAGLDVTAECPERFASLVAEAFDKPGVRDKRRPEAVANLLKWIAATLEVAQENQTLKMSESTADAGKEKICPVFPFD